MNRLKICMLILLAAYFLFLGRVLFFQNGHIDRHSYYKERVVNLVPLSSIRFNLLLAAEDQARFGYRALRLIGGNMLLLFPWGLAAPFLFPRFNQGRPLFFSGVLMSFSAETIQFLFRIGIFELDDILLNSLGVLAGYYVYIRLRHKRLLAMGPACRHQ